MNLPESNSRAADAIVFWKTVTDGDYTQWERHVRRDERRLLAQAIGAALNDQQQLVLYAALKNNDQLRRDAGLLVHTLCQVLAAELEQREGFDAA